jgi:hypothetical protein
MKNFFEKLAAIRKFYAIWVLIRRLVTKKIDLKKIKSSQNFHINDRQLLKMVGCTSKKDAVRKFKKSLKNFIFYQDQVAILDKLDHNIALKKKVIERADKCRDDCFYLLERWVDGLFDPLTKHYKWNMDLFSHYQFKPVYYTEVRTANNVKGIDLKLPWELSRMQYLLFLAEAYLITKDERYSSKIIYIIKDWIECNPPKIGVNWNCTMDVGLRIANMVVAVTAIKESNFLDEEFLWLFMKSCAEHGEHIRTNLENVSKAKCNHYLSDIFGLFCLSIHVTCFKKSRKWLKFSKDRIANELRKQVFADGMDYEGSTSYHRLVCELFYFSALLSFRGAIKLPSDYLPKLAKMAGFIRAITKPDGHIPQTGDNDSGRVFIFSENDYLDHKYIVDLILHETREDYIPSAFAPEEFLWVYGTQNYLEENQNQTEKQIMSFPDAKIVVYKDSQIYLIVNAITNGSVGMGGHTHNDKLAFELQYQGRDFFVDPGTGAYTSFPEIRNKFRSTYSHNTVVVNKTEQSSIDIAFPFKIDNKLLKTNLNIIEAENSVIISGKHNGYFEKYAIEHEREMQIKQNDRTINIIDRFSNSPKQLEWNFVLAPTVAIEKINDYEVTLNNEECNITLIAPYPIKIIDRLYSQGYYNWMNTKVLTFATAENCTAPHTTIIKWC